MAIAKCRLEVWNPSIGGTATDKWVMAQTPENRNAVISVYFLDKLANPRVSEITISNRAKNFAAPTPSSSNPINDDPPSVFSYTYQDPLGGDVGTVAEHSLRYGVLTNFFKDFQFIRLVDQASNQVFFAGRIISIKDSYDAGKGKTILLKAVDALYELSKHPTKNISEFLTFTKGVHTMTDIVKAFISMLYKKEWLRLHKSKGVYKTTSVNTDESSSGNESNYLNIMAQLVADTIYYPLSETGKYKTNIVTDDTGTALRNRFVIEDVDEKALPKDLKFDLSKVRKSGILSEILWILQANPHDKSSSENFGWDYFVDPNISYGEHVDFRGKNLDPATPPPPQMFNAFERGTRIQDTNSEINPAEYGLAIKYPAASSVVTQGHKGTGETIKYATKPMSVGFEFTRPKENLYSSVLLKYNDAEENEGEDKKESGKGAEQEITMEIMYVTELTGRFKYNVVTSGSSEVVEDKKFTPDIGTPIPIGGTDPNDNSGLTASEWLSLYETNSSGNISTRIRKQACRIQYQSQDATSNDSPVAYLLLSHLCNDFLNLVDGTYILKGTGTGADAATNGSLATCKINLGAAVSTVGYPRRVWGIDKQKVMSKGVLKNLNKLRQEVASMLHRSSLDIVDGKFNISGPPMYYWDGEIKSVSSITGGQRVIFKNVGATANVDLWRYGFRAGMVIAKMNAGYTAIVQANERDVYGYCYNILSDIHYDVNLTENESFVANEKVRCFIPLRAGDCVRVECVVADIAGNHLITDLTYTEEPNQMTRLTTTGVNEGFGLGVSGYQASIGDLREESDIFMNIPKGHQIAMWTGLFSAVDNNTVQWQTVAGKAEVILADGTLYNIDTATTNNNNTTDASGTDGEGVRFGLITAPAVGDDTVYYIYVDPNIENVTIGDKNHFYIRPYRTPETGSDPVYAQDGDNIIIAWMKAASTTDGLAEFGVFRDSKPGEGKRNAELMTHAGTATSALLKKGAQTFNTDLMVEASIWDDDLARRELKWHGDDSSGIPSDTEHATIQMADGDSRTIAYGGDSGDNGNGTYSYTSNGSSYSTLNNFTDNKTYYAFIDFAENPTGNMLLRWTDTISVPYGDNRVLLSMIVVPPDATKGRAPLIFPLTTKSLSINAVVIAANSIIGDHIQANTIATGHITGRIAGDKLNITASTTFAVGYDPIAKTSTFVQAGVPTALTSGDIWFDSDDDNKCYLATNAGDNQIGSGEWIYKDVNGAKATADSKTLTFAQDGIPVSITVGDIWIDTNNENKVYRAKIVGADQINSNEWVLYDLNNARAIADGKIQTFIQDGIPTSLSVGDIWIDSNDDYKSYMAASVGADQINAQEWVHYDFGLARATADTAKDDAGNAQATADRKRVIIRKTSTPTTSDNGGAAFVTGDQWIDTDKQLIYGWTGSTWGLRDDAGAINNATTNIAGGRIVTQAIILKAGGAGKPNNADSVLDEDPVSNNGAGASRIVLSNTGIYAWNSSSQEAFSMRIDGSAQFGNGVGFIDRTGMYVNNSSGDKVTWMKGTAGLITGEGFNSGIDFRDLRDYPDSISVWMISDDDENVTYGSHNNGEFKIAVYERDFNLWSLNQDMGLRVDDTYGKIGVYAGNSSPRPLVFMDSTSNDILHSSSNGYVGFTKRTGKIRHSDTYPTDTRSTVYRIPWKFGTGGPTGSGDAGKVLSLVDNGSGSGTQTAPYIYDLEWVAVSGGGGSGTVTSVATTGAITGGTITSTGTIAHSTSAPYKHIPADGSSGQYLKYSSSGTAVWDTISTSHGFHGGQANENSFRTINVDNDGNGSSGGGSILANTTTDILTFVAGSGITLTSSNTNNEGEVLIESSGGGSGTVASGNTGYVAYYTGSTTTGTKVSGGIQYVDSSNITFHAHLDMNTYQIKLQCNSSTTGTGGIKLEDGNASHYVTLKSAYFTNENYDFNFPPDSGVAGEVLKTDGSGNTDWIAVPDGSGTTNRMAYWTDSNTLAANSSSTTSVDLYINDIRAIGVSAYCGITGNLFSKFMGERMDLSGSDIIMDGLSTSTSSTNYLKIKTSTGQLIESGSSRKIKENIVDLTIDSSKVYDLVPRNFKFKDQIIETLNDEKELVSTIEIGENSFGMIAEEVNEILPELVIFDRNNEPKSIDYSLISVLLLTELKKLRARIEVLEEN